MTHDLCFEAHPVEARPNSVTRTVCGTFYIAPRIVKMALTSLRSMLDEKFIQDLSEELKCPICLDLLSNPHITNCCRQYFCYSCLSEAYQKKGPVCPICQQQFTCVPDPDVARRINALRVECPNKNHGCEWVGEYKHFEEHVKQSCDYMVSLCKLGCGQYISRKYREKHNEFQCPNRIYDCHYCGKYRNKFKDVEENHWPVCDRFLVPCPNDCPTGSVPRSHLMDHLKKECQMRQQLTRARTKSIRLEQNVEDLEEKVRFYQANEEKVSKQRRKEKEKIQQLESELASKNAENQEILSDNQELKQQVKLLRENKEKLREEIEAQNRKEEERVVNKRQSLLHNPNLTLQWTQCSDLPVVLCEASAVLCGGYVYAGGGICQRTGAYDNECTVFKYDYNHDSWSKLPTMKRHRFTLVTLHDKLIAVGGKIPDGNHLETLLEWDDNDVWTESFPPMNRCRKEAAAVGHGDYITVARGSNESGSLPSVEVFSSNTRQWYLAKSLPLSFTKVTSALLHDHWYLIGGKEKAACSIAIDSLIRKAMKVASAEDEDVKWESLADTPCELSTATAFGECLLAIGGKTSTVHAYLDGRNYWIPIQLPYPQKTLHSAATVAVSPDELLVIGGSKGFGRYRCVYKATLEQFS